MNEQEIKSSDKQADSGKPLIIGDFQVNPETLRDIAAENTERQNSDAAHEVVDTASDDELRWPEVALNDFSEATGDQTEGAAGDAKTRDTRTDSAKLGPETRRDYANESIVQPYTTKPASLASALSRDALLRDPDHCSTHNVEPQPDRGQGVHALAKTYTERELARMAAGDTKGKKSTLWSHSYHGLEVSTFLKGVQEHDPSGKILENTRAVIAVDSREQLIALEKARQNGMFGDTEVIIEEINPDNPESIQIPKDTRVALFVDDLDTLPAHQVFTGAKSGRPLEVMQATSMPADATPLVHFDPASGQAEVISPDTLGGREIAKGDERFDILPQLKGKFITSNKFFELPNTTTLHSQEESTATYIAEQPTAPGDSTMVYNYVPAMEPFVRKVASGIAQDGGLLLVSGPMRNKEWVPIEDLEQTKGPMIRHVIEEETIRQAVSGLGSTHSLPDASGTDRYGYILVDRSDSIAQVSQAQSTFESTVNGPSADSEFTQASVRLDQARESLGKATNDEERARIGIEIKEVYAQLEEHAVVGGDYSLALELAGEFRAAGLRQDAVVFAQAAADIAPHFSAPLIEQARAQSADGNLEEAGIALSRAHELSSLNPDQYREFMDILDVPDIIPIQSNAADTASRLTGRFAAEDIGSYIRRGQLIGEHEARMIAGDEAITAVSLMSDFKQHALVEYAQSAGDWLNTASDLTPDTIIETAFSISEAFAQQALLHQGDASPAKTYADRDIAKGTVRKGSLTAEEYYRVIAADSALANAEMAAEIRQYQGVKNEQVNRSMEPFLELYDVTVPRDPNDLPLPRDEWSDKPQGLGRYYYFPNSFYVSDNQAPLSILENIGTSEPLESNTAGESADYPRQTRTGIELGTSIDEAGDSTGQPFPQIALKDLNRHMLIDGGSGGGKTVLVKNVIGQCLDANIRVIVLYAGDKVDEYNDLALRYQDKSPTIWNPLDRDGPAINVKVLKPVEGYSSVGHTQQVGKWWFGSYSGNDPFPEILSKSVNAASRENGWDDSANLQGDPITFADIREQAIQQVAAAEYKGEAAGMGGYFYTRTTASEDAVKGEFLEGSPGSKELDFNKVLEGTNGGGLFVVNLGEVPLERDRRAMALAIDAKLDEAIKMRGESNTLRTVIVLDEAQTLLRTSDAQSDPARYEAVGQIAKGFEQRRANGVGMIVATPDASILHEAVRQNSAVKVTFASTSRTAKATASEPWRNPAKHEDRLGSLGDGKAAVWVRGWAEPKYVQVPFNANKPPKQEVTNALQQQSPPPVVGDNSNIPTTRQVANARKAAEGPDQGLQRFLVGAVTLAHTSNVALPTQAPEPLLRQWRQQMAANPQQAILELGAQATESVKRVAPAVRGTYRPSALVASVLASTVDLLNGVSGKELAISSAYSSPSVRIGMVLKGLTEPTYGQKPRPQRTALPLAFRTSGSAPRIATATYHAPSAGKPRRSTIAEQTQLLTYHNDSPFNTVDIGLAGTNAQKAYVGTYGNDNGRWLMSALRQAVDVTGESQPRYARRATAAAGLGYLKSYHSPRSSSPLERVLELRGYIAKWIEAAQ